MLIYWTCTVQKHWAHTGSIERISCFSSIPPGGILRYVTKLRGIIPSLFIPRYVSVMCYVQETCVLKGWKKGLTEKETWRSEEIMDSWWQGYGHEEQWQEVGKRHATTQKTGTRSHFWHSAIRMQTRRERCIFSDNGKPRIPIKVQQSSVRAKSYNFTSQYAPASCCIAASGIRRYAPLQVRLWA